MSYTVMSKVSEPSPNRGKTNLTNGKIIEITVFRPKHFTFQIE